jgi:hypothetical protein
MQNTSNLNANGPNPQRRAANLRQEHEHLRRLGYAQERIETLEDLIRILKCTTPEALPQYPTGSGRALRGNMGALIPFRKRLTSQTLSR